METCETEDPSKTTRLIGRVCKHGNVFSLPVLIGRAAWPQNNSMTPSTLSVVYEFISKFCWKYSFSVAIAKRQHPFPSRTRKLSSSAPMVLHREAVWESRTPPKIFYKAPFPIIRLRGFFCPRNRFAPSGRQCLF